MRLQMVTIPLQIRYKVTRNGPLKFFAFAGFGLNMIVQSDVDVTINIISLHFLSEKIQIIILNWRIRLKNQDVLVNISGMVHLLARKVMLRPLPV